MPHGLLLISDAFVPSRSHALKLYGTEEDG